MWCDRLRDEMQLVHIFDYDLDFDVVITCIRHPLTTLLGLSMPKDWSAMIAIPPSLCNSIFRVTSKEKHY